MNAAYHNFADSLAASHAAEDLPFWREVYEQAFPDMVSMISHRADGNHQRNGVDRSVILSSSKQILIDEKVRWKAYDDILLEFLSDKRRNEPGWVCKKLLCDYIAYAVAPLGMCYLLPVVQLQAVWARNGERWLSEARSGTNGRRICVANNRSNSATWETHSVTVTPKELFPEIGACLRLSFQKCDSISSQ